MNEELRKFYKDFERVVSEFNIHMDKEQQQQQKPQERPSCTEDCQCACNGEWLLLKNNVINLNSINWIQLRTDSKKPHLFFSLEKHECLEIDFDTIEEAKDRLKFIFECL